MCFIYNSLQAVVFVNLERSDTEAGMAERETGKAENQRPEAPSRFVELVSSMNRKGASFGTTSGGESSNWPAAAG
jgi:hypothetical protein